MSDFVSTPNPLAAAPPNPHKHVKYTLGMVLGVDDFTQDFAYISGRDQWALRDLIGYGTVCGLQVKVDMEESTPRILVTPGVALSPRGELIQVTPAQCLRLNAWLAANRLAVLQRLGSPEGAELPLYVTLRYHDCPVDDAPIAGEPCRTVAESMAPSRLVDDFSLELRFAPPDQVEEDAVRDFVGWLSQVEVSDAPGAVTLEEFLEALRGAALGVSSPLSSPPDFMAGSPFAALHIHPADACEFWRTAFRIWVTELRPAWAGNECGFGPDEERLLLAELRLPLSVLLSGDLIVDGGWDQRVYEDRRPYVLHLRMLQEWLLCGRSPLTVFGSPVEGGPAIAPAAAVTPETEFDKTANAGMAGAYSRGDHTHGTPPDPIPAHQAAADAHVLGGDVTGDLGATTVEKLRGVTIDPAAAAPGLDQVLRFDGAMWTPVNLPAGVTPSLAGDVTGDIGANTVERVLGLPVNIPAGAANGHVLTFQSTKWTVARPAPVAGNFVEHPAAPGSFAIVAAGVVRGDGSSRLPNYANLVAQIIGPGELLVNFDDYRQPEGKFLFNVKALAVFDEERRKRLDNRPPIVLFDRFEKDGVGFVLFISLGNGPMEEDLLKELEVMVEVSMYPSLIP